MEQGDGSQSEAVRFFNAYQAVNRFYDATHQDFFNKKPEDIKKSYDLVIGQYKGVLEAGIKDDKTFPTTAKALNRLLAGMNIVARFKLFDFSYDFPLKLVVQNLPEIEKKLRTFNIDNESSVVDATDTLFLLGKVVDLADQKHCSELGDFGPKAINILDENIPLLGKALLLPQTDKAELINLSAKIMRHNDKAKAKPLLDVLKQAIKAEIKLSGFGIVFSQSLDSTHPAIQDVALGILKNKLKKYQWNYQDFIDTWSRSCKENEYGVYVARNVNAIINLEKRYPGITHILYDNFGIMDFGRYPEEVLIRQFEEQKRTDLPYGMIIYPRDDYSGAFYDSPWMEPFFENLEGKFALRIVEVSSKFGLTKKLAQLRNKYANTHKISFAVVGSHGTSSTMNFGETLSISDLLDSHSRFSDFFEKNPTFIFDSCSTGIESGIAQKVSGLLQADIIAPDRNTILNRIDVVINNDNTLVLNAVYNKQDVAQRFHCGQPVKT